jgi:signal transduction histidine kinase
MDTGTGPDRPRPRPALGFTRSTRDRVVAGVAGGLGERLGVDPVFVRLAFVALTFAGGAGMLLYLLGWVLSDEDPADAVDRTVRDPNLQQAVALGLIVLGVLLMLRQAGLWLGDELVWPVVIATAGSAVIWARGSEADRERWTRLAARVPGNPVASILGGRVSLVRLIVGGLLIAAGMAAFLAANDAVRALRDLGLAVLVAGVGAALVFGPWVVRLLQELGEERRERIRSEERAEVAAHLHDSVLQTLAMIQRAGGDARRMSQLARRQERELRAWLYGRSDPEARADTLRTAVDALVEEVEVQHHLTIETVVVGDVGVDEQVRALLGAVREALVNAAKHADVAEASVYVEVQPGEVTAYVRDRGNGFDRDTVPDDRRGIRGSIEDRMRRHGGRAEVLSTPGEGTEVTLVLPLQPDAGRDDPDGATEADPAADAAPGAAAPAPPPPPSPAGSAVVPSWPTSTEEPS